MKEKDKKLGALWMQSFWIIRDGCGPIISKVSQAQHSDSLEDKFKAFTEALEELPVILDSMKQAPKPEAKELRRIKSLEESALQAYIKSCEWSIKSLKNQNRVRYSAYCAAKMVFQLHLATSYWEAASAATHTFSEK